MAYNMVLHGISRLYYKYRFMTVLVVATVSVRATQHTLFRTSNTNSETELLDHTAYHKKHFFSTVLRQVFLPGMYHPLAG